MNSKPIFQILLEFRCQLFHQQMCIFKMLRTPLIPIQKQGGQIPGIRQGTPTAEYIKRILSKITLMGAFFLSFIAIFPIIVEFVVTLCNGTFASIAFGGTSLLIVIGVIQETAREIEAQLTMRNYKGFLN
jgi:preprotein translocase subunit SecY